MNLLELGSNTEERPGQWSWTCISIERGKRSFPTTVADSFTAVWRLRFPSVAQKLAADMEEVCKTAFGSQVYTHPLHESLLVTIAQHYHEIVERLLGSCICQETCCWYA